MTGPLVSIIIVTYNRASTLMRAVESVLRQSYPSIELLVVDDGSADETEELLCALHDPRLRVIRHPKNRGVSAARNTGMDAMRGDWFTFVDSDDEIVPEAIATLVAVPQTVDPEISLVECNGRDADTGLTTGSGITEDRYLDEEAFNRTMKHDHWGLIRKDLLRGDRFNEELPGFEGILWSRIQDRAKAYYIHRVLKIVHRGAADSLSRASHALRPLALGARIYRTLLAEGPWLEKYRKYRTGDYPGFCFQGKVYTLAMGDRASARAYSERLHALRLPAGTRVLSGLMDVGGPLSARMVLGAMRAAKTASRTLRRGRR